MDKLLQEMLDHTFEGSLKNKIEAAITEHLKEWDGKISKKEMAAALERCLAYQHKWAIKTVQDLK